MTQPAADSRPPNEKPTVYRGAAALIGGAIIALFCLFGSVDLMVEAGTRDLTGAAILMLVAVLAAIYGVYPAVFSWSDRLVVRNPFRIIELPWDAVTDLTARLSFVAHTETRHFTVWAIPVSLRERRRSDRHKTRELSQVQRAARRGVSPDMYGPSRSYRPADPIAALSFADQAIAEMNSKREARSVKANLAAKAAEAAKAEAQAARVEAAGDEAAKAGNAAALAADAAAGGTQAPVTRVEGAEPAATVVVDAGTVRWTWGSFVVLGAAVAFLVVAITVHH